MDWTGKINILLVDDRPEGLITLNAVLASPDYNLVTASSGQEALARLFNEDYAVILLDVQMPGMDGFETAAVIKQLERARDIPIIFVTAISTEPKYVLSGYEAGAVDYVCKPFDPAVLRSKVAIFVELYRRKKQLERQAEQLRQAEQRQRVLIEEARDVIATISPRFAITRLNPAFQRLTGWRPEDWIGRPFVELACADDAGRVQEFLTLVGEREPGLFEFRLQPFHGEPVWVEVSARRLPGDSGAPPLMAILRDISERRQVEAERRRRDELERSNRDLQQFAHICSHDLQEPLRQVVSFSQILQKRYAGKLDADADEFIGHVVTGATWMSQLLNEIRCYSGLESSASSFGQVEGAEALERAVANLSMRLQECSGRVTYDELPPVCANRAQLVQLFQNLIGNSVKFRGEQTPHIHVCARRGEGAWVFSVADNGIGFDMRFAERIFAVFQRLHRRDEYPGTGMGLAICKRIVERHGGTIWAESTLGGGSTFFFSIPDLPFSREQGNPAGLSLERPLPQTSTGPILTDKPSLH